MIKAFVYKITDLDKPLIKKMASLLDCGDVVISDLFVNSPEIDKSDICLIYGTKATKHVQNYEARYKIPLPEIHFLHKSEANINHRLSAQKILLEYKEKIHTEKIKYKTVAISKKDFEKIFQDIDTCKLEREVCGHQIDFVKYTLEDGKILTLSSHHLNTGDINLTFTELAALVYSVRHIFKINKMEIIYNESN